MATGFANNAGKSGLARLTRTVNQNCGSVSKSFAKAGSKKARKWIAIAGHALSIPS